MKNRMAKGPSVVVKGHIFDTSTFNNNNNIALNYEWQGEENKSRFSMLKNVLKFEENVGLVEIGDQKSC